ncbi:MAG: PEGA domain-containing protein [Polyangiaceae bacterium]
MSAQTPPPPPVPTSAGDQAANRAEAKARFEQGMVFTRTGNWKAALKEFLASRAAFPTKSATRNAATAQTRLGHNAEAVELYTHLFEEFAADMPPELLAEVTTEAANAQRRTGLLEVRANESGVDIVVDGVQRGTTPEAGLIRLDEGSHTLRLSKSGFESLELTFELSAGTRQVVPGALKQLVETGTLVVREASGGAFDVMLDSAFVGKTPWQGNLAPGTHSVVLRGAPGLGTLPSSAEVKARTTATLTLRAVRLDATLHIEPIPANASAFLDDVALGNGIWVGAVPSGIHRIDLIAAGHLPFRRELRLDPGDNRVVHARLERDTTLPLWRTAGSIPLYVEFGLGALFAPSLRGEADQDCNCSDRSRPLGALANLRVGYRAGSGIGFELSGGYLTITEKMTRKLEARDDSGVAFQSLDYRDSTTLHGPLAALGVAYRALNKTPFTARATAGLAFLSSDTSNSGNFSGQSSTAGTPRSVSGAISIPEASQRLLTPFCATELRFGYRFSKLVSADLGGSVLLFFPPNEPRAGTTNATDGRTRGTLLTTEGYNGLLKLPQETIARSFIAFSPSIAVRADF